jgi:hypothetical protein
MLNKITSQKIEINKPIFFDSIDDSVILLASYPRSGNTWTVNLLEDMLAVNSNKKYIYDIHASKNIFEKINDENFSGILKSHYLDLNIKNKILYIYRDANDVIPSYLRFHKYQGYSGYTPPYSLSLINYFLNEILNHWRMALKIENLNSNNILFIPYEGLHTDAINHLTLCSKFININIDSDRLDKVIKDNAFDVMKKKYSVFTEVHHNEVFLKHGSVGAGKHELSVFARLWIFLKSNLIYSQMKKITLKQASFLRNNAVSLL